MAGIEQELLEQSRHTLEQKYNACSVLELGTGKILVASLSEADLQLHSVVESLLEEMHIVGQLLVGHAEDGQVGKQQDLVSQVAIAD